MSSATPAPNSLGPARSSRRSAPRVTSACHICKQRRRRCDGVRPKCGHCVRNSLECGYEALDLRKARHTAAEFQALNNRIAYLEKQVRDLAAGRPAQLDGRVDHPPNGRLSPPPALVVESVTATDQDWEEQFATFWDPLAEESFGSVDWSNPEVWPWADPRFTDGCPDDDPICTANEETRMTQALGELTISLAQLQVDHKSGKTFFVGPTSNLHFGHYISQCIRDTRELPDPTRTHTPTSQELGTQEQRLLDVYKRRIHPTFPVLEEEEMLQGTNRQTVLPPLLLNIVLAVASFFSKEDDFVSSEEMDRCTERLYMDRFTNILGREVDQHCLSNVKAFLLRAYLAMLEGRLESATIFNSMACAMAKRLGLHVNFPISEQQICRLSPKARTERLTTFWACFWMDRRLAILEGRACHIDPVDISTPRPLQLMQAEDGFTELPLSVELIYACHVEFFYIQDETLLKIYAFTRDSTREDATSKGHLRFISWLTSLPTSMKSIPRGKSFHPSFISFYMCFHAGLILLHRVSLCDEGAAALANQRCRESAAAITTLLKSYSDHFGYSTADPMVIHAAFTAALIHMVLLLYPDIVTFRASLAALRSISRILARFASFSPYATLVLADLQEFAAKWAISPANSPVFWARTPWETSTEELAQPRGSS